MKARVELELEKFVRSQHKEILRLWAGLAVARAMAAARGLAS